MAGAASDQRQYSSPGPPTWRGRRSLTQAARSDPPVARAAAGTHRGFPRPACGPFELTEVEGNSRRAGRTAISSPTLPGLVLGDALRFTPATSARSAPSVSPPRRWRNRWRRRGLTRRSDQRRRYSQQQRRKRRASLPPDCLGPDRPYPARSIANSPSCLRLDSIGYPAQI